MIASGLCCSQSSAEGHSRPKLLKKKDELQGRRLQRHWSCQGESLDFIIFLPARPCLSTVIGRLCEACQSGKLGEDQAESSVREIP